VSVWSYRSVLEGAGVGICFGYARIVDDRLQRIRRVREYRNRGGDEKDVILKRAAVDAVEEVIAEHVLARLGRDRQVGRVEVAHGETFGGTFGDEKIHLPVVYLLPFGIKIRREVNRSVFVNCQIRVKCERCVGQPRGHVSLRLRQHRVGLPSGRVGLGGRRERVCEPFGPLKFGIEAVEAPVLENNHDDVIHFLERWSPSFDRGRRRIRRTG
jgi:hypothetical protein